MDGERPGIAKRGAQADLQAVQQLRRKPRASAGSAVIDRQRAMTICLTDPQHSARDVGRVDRGQLVENRQQHQRGERQVGHRPVGVNGPGVAARFEFGSHLDVQRRQRQFG